MSNYNDKYARCPYYVSGNSNSVRCVGPVKSCYTEIVFRSKERRAEFAKDHCNSIEGCQRCLLYEVLTKKYEGQQKI